LKVLRWFLIWGVGTLAVVAAATTTWVYVSTYHPNAIEHEPIVTSAAAPLLKPGQQIKVLNWNVQFLAGNENNHFFFDGGDDPWPSRETVSKVAGQVAAVIRDESPDIILIQELDDGAARTYFQDQLQQLLDLLPDYSASHTSTYYWKASFVPDQGLMGAVGMKLAIISKYRIEGAIRYALPAITTDNLLVRQFNVKRAVLGVELPIEGGGKLNVLNTHLSAFGQGTDTMELQVSLVQNLLSQFEEKGELAVMAGDFNLIPSMLAYQRLSERNREYYNSRKTEIAPLLAQFSAIPSLQESDGEHPDSWYTHMGNHNHSKVPDKTIDYIFYTDGLVLGDHYVLQEAARSISDHLPVVALFTVPGNML